MRGSAAARLIGATRATAAITRREPQFENFVSYGEVRL
jgi:hypothetical protein